MNRRLMPDDDEPRQAPWLNTYADMMSLLLCFFVMLFAFSVINAKKFQEAQTSISGAFGILPGTTVPVVPEGGTSLTQEEAQAQLLAQEMAEMRALMETFQADLREAGLTGEVGLGVEERGIVFRFQDSVLFDVGKADLRPEAREILTKVGGLLKKVSNQIRVEGFTDNLPISTERFPSNWELSTARATTVVRFFIEELNIDPKRLEAAGYGEYHPIASNDDAAGRQKNRRVDIVLLRPSLSALEPK